MNKVGCGREDRFGNAGADTAADLGKASPVSRVSVNRDGRGGTVPDPLSRVKQREVRFGLTLILLHFLGRLVSSLALGFSDLVVLSLSLTLPPGRTVLVCCVSSLPF